MKRLSKIDESAWGEMRHRGSGKQIRKEDDVNILDIDGLFSYVQEKYSDRVYKIDSEEIRGFQGWKNCVVFPFDDDLEITITYFLDTGKIRDIVILWNENGVQDSFIRKLNDRFNICLAPRENAYIDIKDKDGSVSNQTYIDLLDFVLENKRTDVLIESAWGDMRRRSSGEQIRKEDDVNILDIEDFFTYLENHYKVDNCGTDFEITDGNTIFIPFCTAGEKNIKLGALYYDQEDNVVYTHRSIPPYIPELWNKMVEDFDLWMDEPDYEKYIIINPKDTSRPVNNSYILEVIDYIITNLDSSVTQCIFKKTNESAWGEMRHRGSGKEIRKEDEIGNIKTLKPLDMGGSVLWADEDLEVDGEDDCYFTFDEVFELVKNSDWRLPTLEEVAELDDIYKKGSFWESDDRFVFDGFPHQLVFFKKGLIYTSASDEPIDKDYYYCWTSSLFINNNRFAHIFTFNDGKPCHTPLNDQHNVNDSVTQDTTNGKLCVRLVKDK